MQEKHPIQINVGNVLRQRLPGRHIPRWAVRWLERTICQDRLNEILRAIGDRQGVEAADVALRELGITLHATGLDSLPQGRYIFASNHPLGGLDGLGLISLLGHHYDGDIRFMVNDLLMAVEPLRPVFLPVNKYGRQSRQAATDIEAEYAGHKQMLTFPAGLCSRLQHGQVRDLPWNKSVVSLAVTYRRDIVPVHFHAENTRFFYRLANLRKRLGMKFNAEMVYLPKEMIKKQDCTFSVTVGTPVPWQQLDAAHPREQAQRLCRMVYDLDATKLEKN